MTPMSSPRCMSAIGAGSSLSFSENSLLRWLVSARCSNTHRLGQPFGPYFKRNPGVSCHAPQSLCLCPHPQAGLLPQSARDALFQVDPDISPPYPGWSLERAEGPDYQGCSGRSMTSQLFTNGNALILRALNCKFFNEFFYWIRVRSKKMVSTT